MQLFKKGRRADSCPALFSVWCKKCNFLCFGVIIMNFVFFGVKKTGISVFLVSVENGAGVKKNDKYPVSLLVDLSYFQIFTLSASLDCHRASIET